MVPRDVAYLIPYLSPDPELNTSIASLIAQMVVRLHGVVEVAGSKPQKPTNFFRVPEKVLGKKRVQGGE